MPRTLSAKARAAKTAALREEFPYLESSLDAFRENGFGKSEEVLALIQNVKSGEGLSGTLATRFASLDDDEKQRIDAAIDHLCDAYAEFFEGRRQQGVEVKAKDAMEGLEGDIHKICNFSHGTPYHKARQGMESYLREQASGKNAADLDMDNPAQTQDSPDAGAEKNGLMKDNALKLGAAAGAVTGAVAAGQAIKSWRERIQQPEAKKKAVAFASVAAVSAVGVAAALFLGRGSSGISR